MTKYSVDVFVNGNWETIGLFSDNVSLSAMTAFAMEQFQNGNSVDCPAEDIAVIDMDTGEVLWDWDEDCWETVDIPDDVDESNYDPYMGCDFYDYGGEF